jgi:hypothetical protein
MEGHGMDDVYRNLWSAVLKQAIEDVAKYTSGFYSKRSLSWFEDECEELGSFQWICSILDLHPESIKMFIYQVIYERFSTAINNSPIEFRAH